MRLTEEYTNIGVRTLYLYDIFGEGDLLTEPPPGWAGGPKPFGSAATPLLFMLPSFLPRGYRLARNTG